MLMSEVLERMRNPRPSGDSLPHTDEQLIAIWEDAAMNSTRRTIQPVMEARGYHLDDDNHWVQNTPMEINIPSGENIEVTYQVSWAAGSHA